MQGIIALAGWELFHTLRMGNGAASDDVITTITQPHRTDSANRHYSYSIVLSL